MYPTKSIHTLSFDNYYSVIYKGWYIKLENLHVSLEEDGGNFQPPKSDQRRHWTENLTQQILQKDDNYTTTTS